MNYSHKSAIERRMDEAVANVARQGTAAATSDDLMLAGFSLLIDELKQTRMAVCDARKKGQNKVITIGVPVVVIAAVAGGMSQSLVNFILSLIGS